MFVNLRDDGIARKEPRSVFTVAFTEVHSSADLSSQVPFWSVNLEGNMISWFIIQEFSCRTGQVHEGHDDGLLSAGHAGRTAGTCPAVCVTFKSSLLKRHYPLSCALLLTHGYWCYVQLKCTTE